MTIKAQTDELELEDITTILRDLGYYNERVLERGDRLIGKRCLRNGCTIFKEGDRVRPMLVSTTKKLSSGAVLYQHAGFHAEHHQHALNSLRLLFGVHGHNRSS